MIVSETQEDMAINPSEIHAEEDVQAIFGKYKKYEEFAIELDLIKDLDIVKAIRYMVLLYSEDSVLNTRPPMPLEERQIRAVQLAGLKLYDNQPVKSVQMFLIQLDSRAIFEFIFEFLTKQKKFVWQEIITLETQILENQKLRMKPVDVEDLGGFEKKGKLTIMNKDWYNSLKEFYNEFYGDNQQLRAIHKINRANMASLENMAF